MCNKTNYVKVKSKTLIFIFYKEYICDYEY